MKAFKLVAFIFLISLVAFGCSKKRQEVSGLSGLDIEEDKDVVMQVITSPEEVQPLEIKMEEERKEIPLPAEGPERDKQIQTALRNANLYFGEIDGKIGPLTRKAIEEFQKMKGLKVDGKVGPITWGELQKYLNLQPAPSRKPISETRKKDRKEGL